MQLHRTAGTLALGILLTSTSSTAARAQPAGTGAPADLFYLHPLVNYSIPMRWQARWEANRLAGSSLQLSTGSISTDDLTTQLRVEIDEPLTPHLRVVYRLEWVDTPHVDGSGRQDWIGIEVGGWSTPAGQVGVELVANPASDKGELDLAAGLVWTDGDRRNYLRLDWRSDDFVWEEKNGLGGLHDSVARGPAWAAHLESGAWQASTEGVALAPDERSYPDPTRAPDVASTRLVRSWSSSALRYGRGPALLELRFEHRDYERDLVARAGAGADRDAKSRWRHLRLAWEQEVSDTWRTRAQLHGLRYEHDLDAFRHRREEFLYGIFVERALGWGNWVDLGFLGTFHDWSTTPPDGPYGEDRDDFASKLSLGWTLEVEGRGFLRALLSHEPAPQDFGGGSVMAQLSF